MEEKLAELKGKRVDLNCGSGAIFRGVINEVDDGVLSITDEDSLITRITIRKIIAVTECVEPVTRPGFIV